MTRLWILLAVSLVLAGIIDYRDQILTIEKGKKDKLGTFLLILLLGFFCGLRTWGNDTVTYLQIYNQIPLWSEYVQSGGYDFARGIGFGALTSIIKTLGFSAQNYLMIYAFLTVIPYVLFVRRHSHSMVFCVYLMFATGFYTFSMAAIKQCMATGLCLIAVNCALEKKWLCYFLLVGLAALFHPYAIVYLLVPLLIFKPWTMKTFLYVVLFVSIGFFLEALLGTVLDVTSLMGADYSADAFTGEGVNIFRVAVAFVPMLLAMLYGGKLFVGSTRNDDLMFNMAMVNALIMFVGLFGTANYFARLANYFLPGQIIILPWIIRRVHPDNRKWLVPACVVGYLGYFIYENAVIRPFEYYYAHMSFWQYIAGLL